jgi:adenylate cyclase
MNSIVYAMMLSHSDTASFRRRFSRSLYWMGAMLVALALCMFDLPARRWVEGLTFDTIQRLRVAVKPPQAVGDIVLIGIDSATLDAISPPLALWHRPLGKVLAGVAMAQPRAVAVDIALPERSYDSVIPGGDAALVEGLAQAKSATHLAVALAMRHDGSVRGVHQPLAIAMGSERLGLAWWPRDQDGTIRRYAPLHVAGTNLPLLIEHIATARQQSLRAGYIDFGAHPEWSYVPFHSVLTHADDRAWMTTRFAGKTVLIGGVLPFEDAYRQPLRRLQPRAKASAGDAPGLLLYAHALATLDRHGAMVQDGRLWSTLAALLIVTAACMLSKRRALVIIVLAAPGVLLMSVMALHAGVWVEPLLPWLSGAVALLLRASYSGWRAATERRALERAFAGYVSPALLNDIRSGILDPRAPRSATLSLLFVDLRDSVLLTERLGPAGMVKLLDGFFSTVTQIIHSEGGTVDNFRGDGLLAFFGAPRSLSDTAAAAFAAALAIDKARQAGQLGLFDDLPVRISMGLATGHAITVNVGGTERNNYTAIGAAVNLAARLQELGKRDGVVVAMDAATAVVVDDTQWVCERSLEDLRGFGPTMVVSVRGPQLPREHG